MSTQNNNRVISRLGARQLTQNEIDQIAAGRLITVATALPTGPLSHPDTMLDQ
ncbi:MAG TPA: hypothetical protein VJW20_01200 [Candidatus Angelobacter sp.]|nr:hypothetical protein [Candidatus Angelobacter sp.]